MVGRAQDYRPLGLGRLTVQPHGNLTHTHGCVEAAQQQRLRPGQLVLPDALVYVSRASLGHLGDQGDDLLVEGQAGEGMMFSRHCRAT